MPAWMPVRLKTPKARARQYPSGLWEVYSGDGSLFILSDRAFRDNYEIVDLQLALFRDEGELDE